MHNDSEKIEEAELRQLHRALLDSEVTCILNKMCLELLELKGPVDTEAYARHIVAHCREQLVSNK